VSRWLWAGVGAGVGKDFLKRWGGTMPSGSLVFIGSWILNKFITREPEANETVIYIRFVLYIISMKQLFQIFESDRYWNSEL
jgi:hypothetical protein